MTPALCYVGPHHGKLPKRHWSLPASPRPRPCHARESKVKFRLVTRLRRMSTWPYARTASCVCCANKDNVHRMHAPRRTSSAAAYLSFTCSNYGMMPSLPLCVFDVAVTGTGVVSLLGALYGNRWCRDETVPQRLSVPKLFTKVHGLLLDT